MKTKKIYYVSPDLNQIETTLLELKFFDNIPCVRFCSTIFFPEGGGQPSDTGSFDGIDILDTKIINNEIWHIVLNNKIEKIKKLIDNKVVLKLDRTKRNDYSIQHSAQHLLSAVLFKNYKIQTLSFHLGENYSTLEIENKINIYDIIAQLEKELFNAIYNNLQFKIFCFDNLNDIKNIKLRKFPQAEKDIRIVEIENYESSPCCGTHVKSTGQIGIIKIIRVEKIRDNYKLTFLAGQRALTDYQNKHNIIQEITKYKTCNQNEILDNIKISEKEISEKVKEVNNLKKQIINQKKVEILESNKKKYFYSFFDYFWGFSDMLLNLINSKEFYNFDLLVLGSEVNKTFLFRSPNKMLNLKKNIDEIKLKYGCKGGGNNFFAKIVFDSLDLYQDFYRELNNNYFNTFSR